MNDFELFYKEWQKENDKSIVKIKSFDDFEEDIRLHDEGKLINPIGIPSLPSMSQVCRFSVGDLVLVTGYPQSGKSELIRFLAAELCDAMKCKAGVFTPESNPAIFLSEMAIMKGSEHAKENWFILHIEEGLPDLDEVIDKMKVLHSQGVRVFVIDPFNYLASLSMGGGFEMLTLGLTRLKQFAKKMDSIIMYVEHPKTPRAKQDGTYARCSVFMVNMGVMHFNKCDAVLILHRIKSEDVLGNTKYTSQDQVELEVAKRKNQKYLGRPGTISLNYDYRTFTYNEHDNTEQWQTDDPF